MITVYKTTNGRLEQVKSIEDDCWVNIVDPTQEEIAELEKNFAIPSDFLTDPLDVDERARIAVEDEYSLIIIRIPIFEENEEVPFTTMPIGIIISDDIIFTISKKDNLILHRFTSGKVKRFSTDKHSRFILQIFYYVSLLYLNYLKVVDKRATEVEKELHKSLKNEELIRLLNLEKSLVYFTTSLRSNELMMEKLQRMEIVKMYVEDKELLDDVIIENKQAIETANIHSNILSGMMDAFASVISNNLNVVMKFLTSITIILMIPTLIASFYGMNVSLPFQHSPNAFLYTIILSVLLVIIGVFIFIKRRWF